MHEYIFNSLPNPQCPRHDLELFAKSVGKPNETSYPRKDDQVRID